jgi:DNA primase
VSRSASVRIPDNWRDRLPDPASYYAQHVAKLGKPNATGWAQGPCPFHEDRNASLSVHITSMKGPWRCFASCGGGDLVGFHMRRTGLDFKGAVRDLIGLGAYG